MQKALEYLDKIFAEFLMVYYDYKHGRNIKIRESAEGHVDSLIRLAFSYFDKNPEMLKFLPEYKNNSDIGQAIIYAEFHNPQYFETDIGELLGSIKETIDVMVE